MNMLGWYLAVLSLLTLQVSCKPALDAVEPFDDIDDGLKNLEDFVQSSIKAGQDSIDSIANVSRYVQYDLWSAETRTFDIEYENINIRLRKVKALAAAHNADIGVCLQWREDVIFALPKRCTDDLNTCIAGYKDQIEGIQSDGNANLARIKAAVASFSVQVKLCNGERTCLEPIIASIESFQKELPDRVSGVVDEVQRRVDARIVHIENCMDTGIAYMLNTGAGCLQVIASCAYDIIGY